MKILFFLIIYSSNILSNITFEELDYIRAISKNDSQSIIANGTNNCINYFEKNTLKQKKNIKTTLSVNFPKPEIDFMFICWLLIKKVLHL